MSCLKADLIGNSNQANLSLAEYITLKPGLAFNVMAFN